MAKGVSKQKQNKKQSNVEISGRKIMVNKNIDQIIDFLSPFKFLKLFLTVEQKS